MVDHDRKGKKRATTPPLSDPNPSSSDDGFQAPPPGNSKTWSKDQNCSCQKKAKSDGIQAPTSDQEGEASSCTSKKKTKSEIKFEHANKKRSAKHEAKAKEAEEKAMKKAASGVAVVCPTCHQLEQSRSSNKACLNYRPKRINASELKRTSIIKTSLKNTCRNERFIAALQKVVEHVRDVTYVGSLFANLHILRCINENQRLPSFSHGLFYDLFSTIMGKGSKATAEVKESIPASSHFLHQGI
ncbi:uncharacterized protein BYT42DRAFT_287384 [Radiomyces spectabilis]|uniref:uncharacterized protein n=1 Tax=Radiomyces spectabilis TaxID=64574 RepID=UPI00221E7BE2|nr:uncharacterized protein BYT42DRAFT_287384 [Radiomyces spectabilis]KAI8380972.1 hypothetical protein BYT42DRAFT_287384 [Radiomyces spectabilis]